MANELNDTNEATHTGCLLLTLAQVANLLGIDRNTAGRWLRAGRLPAPITQDGKRKYWSRAALVAWANHGASV